MNSMSLLQQPDDPDEALRHVREQLIAAQAEGASDQTVSELLRRIRELDRTRQAPAASTDQGEIRRS